MNHFIQELREFTQIDDDDHVRMLASLPLAKPCFGSMIQTFYNIFYQDSRSRIYFENEAQINRLKDSLLIWVHELFEGPYDEHYYQKRIHIGTTHFKVGLLPHFVCAAITIVRAHLSSCILQAEKTSGQYTDHITSLHKILDLEQAIMLQVYWDTLIEQKLRMPTALAMGLAHELRNPLNGLGLNLTLLERRLRRLEDTQDLTPMIEVMRHELRRITTMTDDIMDFSKPIEVHPATRSPQYIIQEIQATHGPTLAAANITLTCNIKSQEPLWVDADRLHQVLTNLINNAAEAIEHDGHIELTFDTNAHTSRIEIVDTGGGMDPSLKYRAFELFYTTKTSGTGLGLPIVRKIMEAHNGSVDITIQQNVGTRFSLTLPKKVSS